MTLALARAAQSHTPVWTASLDGVPIPQGVLAGTIDLGWDTPVAVASLSFAAAVTGLKFTWRRQELAIDCGFTYSGGTFTRRRFTGLVDKQTYDLAEAQGFTMTIRASGRLSLARKGLPSATDYSSQTGKAIHQAQLALARVTHIGPLEDEPGGAITFFTVASFRVERGTSLLDLLDRINTPFGMAVWEGPTGMVERRYILGAPAIHPSRSRSTANPDFFRLSRDRDVSEVVTEVIVTGRPRADGATVEGAAEGSNALALGTPAAILPEDALQTDAECQRSADLLILDLNRAREEFPAEIVGDPRCVPGDVESLADADLDWATPTNYVVKHVHEELSERGYLTFPTYYGGETGTGSPTIVAPRAAFVVTSVRKVGTDWVIHLTDVSTDPDGLIASRAWTTSAGTLSSATAESPTITQSVSTGGDVTITLTVTDNDGLTDVATRVVHLDQISGSEDTPPPIDDATGQALVGLDCSGFTPSAGVSCSGGVFTLVSTVGVGATALATASPSAPGAPPSSFFGVTVGGTFTYPVPSGAQRVAYDGSGAQQCWWIKHTFTLPPGNFTSAVLEMSYDDVAWAYINGVAWGPGHSAAVMSLDVTRWVVPAPGLNTLHFLVCNTLASSPDGIAYRLVVS